MVCRSRTSPAAEPLDDDVLLAEILLRLPPKPSSLPRASLVCKRWRSITTDAAFRRRFRARHRKKPPILGVFHECAKELKFVPIFDPPDRIPSDRFSLHLGAEGLDFWSVLGCRHGRVLIINRERPRLIVFEPVSGHTLRILIPPEFLWGGFANANAAVLCDDLDHLHGDCHSSTFKVVVVGTKSLQGPAIARVYSSESGIWGDLVSTECTGYMSTLPCTLVGNALYWWLTGSALRILHFDLDNQSLAAVNGPPLTDIPTRSRRIVRAKDDNVGVVILLFPCFQVWDRKVNSHGAATWILWKTINMHDILGLPSSVEERVAIVGYAEEADAIFISVHGYSFFIAQLESMQFTKDCGRLLEMVYHPFVDFILPVPLSEQTPKQ